MKLSEIKKINEKIEEFKKVFKPNNVPTHIVLNTKKRNQTKRLSKKLRGK